MGAGYRVDLAALGGLAQDLEDVAVEVGAAVQQLGVASAGATGHEDLAAVLGSFRDRWEHGIDELSTSAGSMCTAVRAGADSYAEAEEVLAPAFGAAVRAVLG